MTDHSKTIRTLLLGSVAALSLGLAGCKDTAEGAATEAVGALRIEGVSKADLASRFEVAPRTVDTASAEAALAEIEMLEQSDDITWARREGDAGTYTYTDVVIMSGEDDDKVEVKMARLDLLGARMDGERTRFDKIVIDDLQMSDDQGVGLGTVDAVTLIDPRVETVAFLGDDGEADELPKADAFAIDGVNIKTEDDGDNVTITLETAAYAAQTEAGAKDGFFTLSDLSMDGTTDSSGSPMPFSVSLDSMQVTDMTSLDEMQGMGGGAGLGSAVSNPYSLPFKQASVEDFAMNVDGLSIDTNGLQMVSETSGSKITVQSAMEPLTVTFDSDPTSPQLVSLRDGLAKMGYERMVFTSESESVVDLDTDTAVSRGGHFTMEDGFRMEIDQDIRGVGAMQAAQTEALAEAGFENAPGPNATEDEQRAYNQAMTQAGMSSIGELAMGEMVFRFDDNSIVEKIFEVVAESQGTSAKMLRAQSKSMLAMATMMGSGSGVDEEIIADTVTALGEFLDNPGSELVIGIDPEGYIPVEELPGKDAATLNFSASVNK